MDEFEQYFRSVLAPRIIAPWSRAWTDAEPAQRAAWEQVRRTWWRAEEIYITVDTDPEVRAAFDTWMKALWEAGGGPVEAKHQTWQQLRVEKLLAGLAKLRAENNPAFLPRVLEIWQQDLRLTAISRNGNAEAQAAATLDIKKLGDELANLMGPRLTDGPGVDFPGYYRKPGPPAVFAWLRFKHPDEQLPALMNWLARQGCTELRFGMTEHDADDDGA